MRKFLLCSALLLATAAFSQDKKEGYTGPSIKPSTVKEAKQMRDDTPIVLEGKIERSLGDEKYVFNDGKDTITVEIDNDLWKGLSISEKDIVTLYGEVEIESSRNRIVDVDKIAKK